MRKIFTGLFLSSLLTTGYAQDLAMAPPLGTFLSPVSGCSMSATEAVTIRIFNAGPTLPAGTSFNVSYSINAGAPVVELVTLAAPLVNNTTLTYTFTSTANLATAGTYSFDANVTIAGDIVPGNDTYTGYSVVSSAASNGGTATGGTNVCNANNAGNITLTGTVGNVLNWEYSTDAGVTWVNISNVTTSQSYNDLAVETWYRANVQNASCPIATSTIAIMTIDPTSVGGTTAGGTTPACSGSNSGTITLSGKTGNVLNWEFSTNGGVTWTNIANTTTSNAYSNLTVTTRFRARVQSGSCPAVYSSQRIITVNPASVGGTVSSDATVCSGANTGTLTLSGQTGTVQSWEFSTDGGVSWNTIANTTTSQNYLNLTQTTMYRARVRSNPCSVATSVPATITVVSASNGGTLAADATVCTGANTDTLQVSGYSGSIVGWEYSTDGGTTWNPYASTADTLIYTNLTTTTNYRVEVLAGGCTSAYSNMATITVDTLTVGGTVSGNTTLCASGNSGSLTLSGQNGTIAQWESSTDGGITWNPIANTTTTENYSNLTLTTLYRVQSASGVCPSGYSDTATVTVDPITVAGVVDASTTVCSGNNAGSLNLTGSTGSVLNWEFSTDGGITWITIANTTTTQNYSNIATTTQYRATVQSGVCPSAIATAAVLSIDAQAVGGTLYGGTTVCATSNSGSLTLVGFNASVVGWEFSTDGGVTYSPIANTTPFYNFSNLTGTTDFRVITASGVCPNDTSTIATVQVDSSSTGGSVTANDTVCAGANNGTLVLSGQSGSVVNWEMSNDGGVTWITLANDTLTQSYLNLMNTTTYRAKVKNGVCPAVGSTPATITVNQQSVGGEINASATVCAGQNFGVLNIFGEVGNILDWEMSQDGGVTWTALGNTGTTQSYSNLTDTTWYHAIVQSGICAADTSDLAIINMYPSPVAGFNPDTVCQGSPLTFVNTTTNSVGFITLYNWTFGDGNTSGAVNPIHTYSIFGNINVDLFVMNNFGCTDTVSQIIVVNNLPVADIFAGGPTSFCYGDTVQLFAPFNVNYAYSWNTGETNFQITADTTFDYTVTVTDVTNGCVNTDTEIVNAYPIPVANAGADTTVSLGFGVNLMGSGGISYQWTPATGLDNAFIANPMATPTTTTTYIMEVSNIYGCINSDTVVVSVNNDYLVTVRNVLTPNGDGFNDKWIIENIESYPGNTVYVYNRNGQKVFEGESYMNTWEGTYNNQALPDGTYYYVIEFTDSDVVVKGAVNIISSNTNK
ncbi:MAG: gliding motility-associated C-terminal domain-containing protein [Flavobacteriales bacterium]|nr:gliding motility-associated C-terminal domain-containing protein [Flavobacteriales bacterium]